MESEVINIRRLKRADVPKQTVESRIQNFKEVSLGFSAETAMLAASRCLNCPKPTCRIGCPVDIDIPGFINYLSRGKFDEANHLIKQKNNLPAICGRVCPQETQCEARCVLGVSPRGGYQSASIGALERFVADYALQKGLETPDLSESVDAKVAIIGSGPAGLTASADLARLGHEVTIYEALHKPGGVLLYGIPEFRLPKQILETEVEYIRKLGVKIQTNVVVGKTVTLNDLFDQGYKAVFAGIGAGSPYFLGVPGENLNGVYSANEFLTRINLMNAYLFPKYDTPIILGEKVVIMGGGNVAMDSARTALRLGHKEVSVIYRRSENEMPARLEEIRNAQEEGVKFHTLTNPIRFIDKDGWVSAVECVKTSLGPPDSSGRRKPVPIPGSNFTVKSDTVIIAIGQRPNPLVAHLAPGVKIDKTGRFVVDQFGLTSGERIWAGGDITPGEGTVINAMGQGKTSANNIHRFLTQKD